MLKSLLTNFNGNTTDRALPILLGFRKLWSIIIHVGRVDLMRDRGAQLSVEVVIVISTRTTSLSFHLGLVLSTGKVNPI